MAVDPQTPTTVYAGGECGGIFKTTDGGGRWSPVNTGLGTEWVRALAIDPQTPTTLYASTGYYGVSKSTDGGASWSALNAGLPRFQPGSSSFLPVVRLSIDPQTPTTLYAGTAACLCPPAAVAR